MAITQECILNFGGLSERADILEAGVIETLDEYTCSCKLSTTLPQVSKIDKKTICTLKSGVGDFVFQCKHMRHETDGVVIAGKMNYKMQEYKQIKLLKGERLSSYLSEQGIVVKSSVDDVAKKDYIFQNLSAQYLTKLVCYDNNINWIWKGSGVELIGDSNGVSVVGKLKIYKQKSIFHKSNFLKKKENDDVWDGYRVETVLGNYKLLSKASGDVTGTIVGIETYFGSHANNRSVLYVV